MDLIFWKTLLEVLVAAVVVLGAVATALIEWVWSPVRSFFRQVQQIDERVEHMDERMTDLEHMSAENSRDLDQLTEMLKAVILDREHPDIELGSDDLLDDLADEGENPRAHDYLNRGGDSADD